MNLLKHQLYLLEQHSQSFKIWSDGKSLIMKLGPEPLFVSRMFVY